jgi:predicted regulator of Ras-like GTPase activity (Roadblock/LC7/MglB family)
MEDKNEDGGNKDGGKEEKSPILEFKSEFQLDQNISTEVQEVIDDAFEAMVGDHIKDDKDGAKLKTSQYPDNISEIPTPSHIDNSPTLLSDAFKRSDGDLKKFYENKIEELNAKIVEYGERYQKLEEIAKIHEERNRALAEKRNEYEQIKAEFDTKVHMLEDSKKEFQDRNEKLQLVREQFVKLSKEFEEKKNELERKEKDLVRIEKSFENSKYELEKNKIDFKKEKLEFELQRKEFERDTICKRQIEDSKRISDHNIVVEEEKKLTGKSELVHGILKNLCNEGLFQSCFLIDSKGMMISEYNDLELDTMAIGAMFSLISTSALRTVKSLNLQELTYFKLASSNGEFTCKCINISNYERTFILLTHHDKNTPSIPKSKKVSKKIIKQVIKSIKNDFSEFNQEDEISWVFDNLNDKIDFIKKKHETPNSDLELMRINKINESSIKIKELFEK